MRAGSRLVVRSFVWMQADDLRHTLDAVATPDKNLHIMLYALTLPLVGAFLAGSAPIAPPANARSSVVMAETKHVAVGVIGTGLVGGELLKQIEEYGPALKKQGVELTVASISKTRMTDGERKPWMLCEEGECTLDYVEEKIKDPAAGEEGDFLKMADFLKSVSPHAIMVDATASEAVSDYYPKWLAKGVHVVTPNKKAGSGDLARWKECTAAMEATGAMWGDETTVGAGLPILNVLRTDLLATGDKVKTIEGIFSGTLSYIFNTYKPGMKFSDVIDDAKVLLAIALFPHFQRRCAGPLIAFLCLTHTPSTGQGLHRARPSRRSQRHGRRA